MNVVAEEVIEHAVESVDLVTEAYEEVETDEEANH